MTRSADDDAQAEDYRQMFERVYFALNAPEGVTLFSRSNGDDQTLIVSTAGNMVFQAITASPGWEDCEPPPRQGTSLTIGRQDELTRLL